MKTQLVTIAATAAVTTVINYKFSVWKYKQAEDSFKESAAGIGNLMYNLGKIHGVASIQKQMMNARAIVADHQYVTHTMN